MPPTRRQADSKGDSGIDLGIGGLLRGFGDLINLVSDMVEQGETELHREGEFGVPSSGGRLRGVYGISVRTGIGGVPQVERFGNIRSTAAGPVVADIRAPLVDLFDEGSEIVLVVELPGVAEQEIVVELRGDIVAFETTGERKFASEVLLPAEADPASLRTSYRNGILEVRLVKLGSAAG